MDSGKKKNRHHITLHPADQEKLKAYCERMHQKEATIIRDMAHCAITGILVRKSSGREYLDVS